MFLGIDPGASGGIAQLDLNHQMQVYKMPDTERDISDIFEEIASMVTLAVIERVHSMPAQGVSSVFSFGRNYGFLRGMLIAHKIPFEEVTPQKWQKFFGLLSVKDEKKTAHKNRLKSHAQQLFPGSKLTLATSDAALIAEYTFRTKRGMVDGLAS